MSMSQRLRRLEPFCPDIHLAACAFWSARCFTGRPGPFDSYARAYFWVERLQGQEDRWARLSLVVGTLLLAGLVCTVRPLFWALSLVLRSLGYILSAFLWGTIGISFMLASRNALTALPLLLMSAMSLWALLRAPALPRLEP